LNKYHERHSKNYFDGKRWNANIIKKRVKIDKKILVDLNPFENLTPTLMVAIIQQLVMISNNKMHHHS
jgi:hypothetical protein